MRPITCSRPRSCLPLFIFYTYLIFIGEIIAGKLCFYSQEVRIQHVFGISIRINVFIYKLLICVHLFFFKHNKALFHFICIDDVVSLINVRCKYRYNKVKV